jgi:serine protease Do
MEQTQPKNNGFLDRIRNHRLSATFLLLGVLSAGILAGSALTTTVHGKEQQINSSDAAPLRIPPMTSTSNAFSTIAKQVGPAVVNINTESLPKQSTAPRRRTQRRGQGQGNEDPQQQGDMQDFFNRFFGGQPGGGDGDDEDGAGGGERRALGSGFIVDPRGYIITNNHVVDKADKIYVKLSTDSDNGLGRLARVIGTDKDTDIAVIKIDAAQALPTVKLGNSDSAQVGDWVLAIGSPFNLSQTVTAGIVSAKNRTIEDGPQSQFQRFIQTDASINPGNSGGPLVDMNGAVIGVNTAIYTQSAGSVGLGFAMPSNTVINVYNMLIAPEHKVVRGSIGISFQPGVSSAVSRMYGFSKGGVLINTITPNGPAAKAGLQPQDVIVAIDDRQVKDGDDLVADIAPRHPGSTAKITYLRNGKQNTATVTIGDRAKTVADIAGNGDQDDNSPQKDDATQGKIGITVGAVPPALAKAQEISGGVVVTAVRPGSFADDLSPGGLEKGDIILEINRHVVTDQATLTSIVNNLKSGDDVVFVVRKARIRDKSNTFLGGTLP